MVINHASVRLLLSSDPTQHKDTSSTVLTIVGPDMGQVLFPQPMGLQEVTQVNQVEGFTLLSTQGRIEGGPLCVPWLYNDTEGLSRGIGNVFCAEFAL